MSRLSSRVRPVSALEQYSQFFDGNSRHFVSSGHAGSVHDGTPNLHRRYEIAPEVGNGWIDLHQFGNGLMVGRMHCCFAQAMEDEYQDFPDNIRLVMILGGEERLLAQSRQKMTGEAGDVVLRHADPGRLCSSLSGGRLQTGISIDIPRSMLQTLQEQGVDMSFAGRRDSCRVLKPSADMAERVRSLGQRMLALQAHESLLARLQLESLSLDMLLQLITAAPDAPPRHAMRAQKRWQAALDEALDILHAEWRQPLTIAQLARRAGINECYLKALFRERTGQTVAGYLRGLRMRHAREMLESGHCTLQQVAHICGYSRADKFSQAFRQVYGMLPSALC